MAVVGMNRRTGALLSGMDHLLQSLTDILSTRRGTRRERPEYGSDLPDKVDLPITRGWVAAAQAEGHEAVQAARLAHRPDENLRRATGRHRSDNEEAVHQVYWAAGTDAGKLRDEPG